MNDSQGVDTGGWDLAEITVLIREAHLDTFGHVNNATYLSLFEQARWDIIEAGGYGLSVIRRTGLGPVVLEANIKFLREIGLRESIRIQSRAFDSQGGKIMRMRQLMMNSRDELCCEAEFKFGLFSLKERKLVLPTPEWLRAIGAPKT